ncbi:unnamed protein product [Tilletia controversa]|nr:unnamed protein product [Tilletia controversa]CAD6920614.1 unnamed protein product [Tilletia controversa]CAD6928230.1 unnamed protein product [Tilletia controversa]CAD6953776.1 unnamed protein product [Tilletia controversa]CAD6966823.1 unnamed protein product [Tilletia controversa]
MPSQSLHGSSTESSSPLTATSAYESDSDEHDGGNVIGQDVSPDTGGRDESGSGGVGAGGSGSGSDGGSSAGRASGAEQNQGRGNAGQGAKWRRDVDDEEDHDVQQPTVRKDRKLDKMPSEVDSLQADIEQLHLQLLSKSPIYNFLLQDIKFVTVSPSSSASSSTPTPTPTPSAFVQAHLPLSHIHLNSHKSLHGAVAATIVDWIGGIVIATLPKQSPDDGSAPASALTTPRGVSVDIHVRYLSAAAKLGDTLIINAWSHKIGRTLAFVTVQLAVEKPDKQPASDNTISSATSTSQVCVVEASHTKYIS